MSIGTPSLAHSKSVGGELVVTQTSVKESLVVSCSRLATGQGSYTSEASEYKRNAIFTD